jgi:hypothetical protein
MLKIITDDYVVYEIWECDDNGMPYAFIDHFDSLDDAERDLLVLNDGKMLGDPAGDYTL